MTEKDISFGDLSLLTQEELFEEYKKLFAQNQQLKIAHEGDNQQIYELRRNLQTSAGAVSYLSQELELISSSQSGDMEKIKQKHNSEIEELRKKYLEEQSYNSSFEQTIDELQKEIANLKSNLEELNKSKEPRNVAIFNDSAEKEMKLEKENLDLLGKLDEFQEKINKSVLVIAEHDRHIEILKEQLQCTEENLQSKRDEVEEKTLLLESTQEQMIELNAELAMLKSAPENDNRKGNSLFAEVDDQRQEMKRILAAQKKHYLEMKKFYHQSEHEIRRLKRENSAMHKELEACTSIFLNADKVYKEKLNQRIRQLLKQNEDLEKKLQWTQESLIELGNNKGIYWLDSMLSYCKNETNELKEQLHSCRLQKGILEENLRNSQQDLAKWRFEALKSRCIIINRETLLEENHIHFDTITLSDCKITENDCHEAKPQILTTQIQNSNLSNTENEIIEIISPPKKNTINSPIENPSNDQIKTELPDLTNKTDSNGLFEIYEDTSKSLPIINKNCINIPKEFVDKENIPKVETIKLELKDEEVNFQNENCFEIYEDTTVNFPPIKSNIKQKNEKEIDLKKPIKSKTENVLRIHHDTTEEQEFVNHSLKQESNNVCENFQLNEMKFETKVEENKENRTNSILVKNRDILFDDNDKKSVTFNDIIKEKQIENVIVPKLEEKHVHTKSNVMVKRIVFKSNVLNKK